MHVSCEYALKLVFGFFCLFLGQGLTFCGENRLATMLLIVGAALLRLIFALTEANLSF